MAAPLRFWRWDGSSVVPHRGGIPISDRGFRYGQHLFESIAVRDGKTLLVREHLALLKESAACQGIPFARSMAAGLKAFLAGVRLPDGMLRVYLTAGSGAAGAEVTQPGCYLAWEGTRFPSRGELGNGIRLVTLKHPVAGRGWGQKTGNYMAHLDAISAARASGADEAVVLGERGNVVSCAMGNLLAWLPSNGGMTLRTPAGEARHGAVLRWVESTAALGRSRLARADLRRAVALAVTNSRLGVMPVASLDGKAFTHTALAHELSSLYLRSHGIVGGA